MVGPFLAGVGVLLLPLLFFLLVGDRAGDLLAPRGDPDSEDEAEEDDADDSNVDVDDFCRFRLFLEGDDPRCL